MKLSFKEMTPAMAAHAVQNCTAHAVLHWAVQYSKNPCFGTFFRASSVSTLQKLNYLAPVNLSKFILNYLHSFLPESHGNTHNIKNNN